MAVVRLPRGTLWVLCGLVLFVLWLLSAALLTAVGYALNVLAIWPLNFCLRFGSRLRHDLAKDACAGPECRVCAAKGRLPKLDARLPPEIRALVYAFANDAIEDAWCRQRFRFHVLFRIDCHAAVVARDLGRHELALSFRGQMLYPYPTKSKVRARLAQDIVACDLRLDAPVRRALKFSVQRGRDLSSHAGAP